MDACKGITIRPVAPEDREAIVSLCSDLYCRIHGEPYKLGSQEYVINYLDDWIQDQFVGNVFLKATAGERVVGVGNLAFLGDGEVMLEGGRVAHDYWRQGVASSLIKESILRAKELYGGGPLMVRFMTDSDNHASIQLAKKCGLTLKASFRVLEGMVLQASPNFKTDEIRLVTDPRVAWEFLVLMDTFRLNQFYASGWRVKVLTRDKLSEFVTERCVYCLVGTGGSMRAIAGFHSSPSRVRLMPTLQIAFIHGLTLMDVRVMAELMRSVLCRHATSESMHVMFHFVEQDGLSATMQELSLLQERDHLDLVFEQII